MSSSLPGLFIPTIIDNCCYIDGGVLCNYPLNQCLRDHTNKDEILGIKLGVKDPCNNESDKFPNIEVTSDSSLLEYVICMSINSMNYIRDTIKMETIENTVLCYVTDNPLTLDSIKATIQNQELRRQMFKMGEDDAITFLETLKSS
jgi:predicted acylesterase/phospholipase RssA